MKLVGWFTIMAAFCFAAPRESARPEAGVRGRVEIKNPRARLQDGRPDAGGVAVWLAPLQALPGRADGVRPRVQLEQKGKRFLPHVTIVELGTEIDFPNRDPFFHNVFSVYDGKRFDLGLYASGETRPVRFDRPGISYIFCNIHPQMSAVVLTVATPYFDVSKPDGSFSIPSPPPGRYKIHFWHERCDAEQLAALTSVVSLDPKGADLGVVTLDEAGYVPKEHKNKHGRDYDRELDRSPYPRP